MGKFLDAVRAAEAAAPRGPLPTLATVLCRNAPVYRSSGFYGAADLASVSVVRIRLYMGEVTRQLARFPHELQWRADNLPASPSDGFVRVGAELVRVDRMGDRK